MKIKAIAILLLAALMVALFAACSPIKAHETAEGTATAYTDFAGKRIGMDTGTIWDVIIEEHVSGTPVFYTEISAGIEDIRKGRLDSYMTDYSAARVLVATDVSNNLTCVEVPSEVFSAPMGAVSMDQNIIDRFNVFLSEANADGSLADMQARWLDTVPDLNSPMPEIQLKNTNGTLRVATNSGALPFSYVGANGELKGYSIELVRRFAAREGMDIEFADMDFGGMLPYVISGKADLAIANISITEERKKSVLFTDSIYDDKAGIIAPKTDTASNTAVSAPRDYTDFAGKRIGMDTGTIWDVIIEEHVSGTPVFYTEISAGIEDIRKGRLDSYMTDYSAARVLVATDVSNNLTCVEVPSEVFSAPMGAVSMDQNIIDRFNVFLSEANADGSLADMQARWLDTVPDLNSPMPEIQLKNTNGTLRVATNSGALPFSYVGANGELKGYSIELVIRFAAREGMDIEFADMDFGGMLPYVISGKADLAIANISITEERKKSVLFTDSIYDDKAGIIALKTNTASNTAVSAPRDYTDFAGKRIGMRTGSIWDVIIEDHINGIPAFYTEMSAGIEDIRKGRLDGFMTDYSATMVFVANEGNGQLISVEVPSDIFTAPMGVVSMDQDMVDRFNVFLAEIKADGTLADMYARWLDVIPDLDSLMPEIPSVNTNGVLRVATSAEALPFAYVGDNGELKGYSIELIRRFAAHEEMEVEFFNMEFGGMLPFVVSGKADFAIADITITEERKKSVLFTDSIYDDRAGIITLKTDNAAPINVRSYEDFAGKRLGVITGSVHDAVTQNELNATPVYYTENSAIIEDLRSGRLDGFTTDMSSGRILAITPGNEDLECIGIPAEYYQATSGIFSMDQGLIDRFNVFLKVITDDGTLEEMHNRWLNTLPDLDSPMPDIPTTGANGTLTAATYTGDIPFTYAGGDGELKGYSIELAQRFAAYEGMNIEFIGMEFSPMIPYVVSGKADLGVANTFITEERKQSVLFTESVFNDTLCIIALRQNKPAAQVQDSGDFLTWLKTGIERNLITDNRWKMVVSGLGVTMTIAVLAQIFGTVFACFVCWLLTRKNRFVRWVGNLYCGLIYGTPIVVLLMITYYIIFGNTSISNVFVAVAAFTMITGATVATGLKGAIETVDAVEIEAARSIGFSAFKAFRAVTLPQAVRRVLPGYTNGFVELVKATAIVGYIAIQDLTRAGDIIRSRTYDAYFPLMLIAVIYLIVTTVCVQVFKFIVKKVNKGGAA